MTLGSGEMTVGEIKWSKLFLSLSVLYTDAKPSNKISDSFFFKNKYINKQATIFFSLKKRAKTFACWLWTGAMFLVTGGSTVIPGSTSQRVF